VDERLETAMAKRRKVGNLLALSLLSLLAQKPMYPYEMAQTMRARGKEQNFKINWGSLYTVVRNLEKNGFIKAVATEREGRQPERTTYQITDQGWAELRDWLRELLGAPEDEQSPFAAALSEAGILSPDEVVGLLVRRLTKLDEVNGEQRKNLEHLAKQLPRLFLIESEYQLAMRMAEAGWVRGLIDEIVGGTIAGLDAWRQIRETGEIPQEYLDLDARAKRGWDTSEGDGPETSRT
jgi:DNA-binding PadR family transcriptional regulator